MVTNAHRYVINKELYNDFQIPTVEDAIREYAKEHEKRLLNRINVEAIQLLNTSNARR